MRKAAAPARAWQRMLSGRRLDLLDPSPLDVEIEDIAHGLARVPRWNGQTRGEHIFSVAQHSLNVEIIARALKRSLSDRWRLAVLLHDAPEYVVGDIITPFKAVLGSTYKDVEIRLLRAVHLRFGLPADLPADLQALLKRADRIAAHAEATALAGFSEAEAAQFFESAGTLPQAVVLEPWPADVAEQRFLERFHRLASDTKLSSVTPT
jgi:uncharacterized protein